MNNLPARRGNHLGVGVSLLATLGAGAVLMFVLDPERGSDRRNRIARSVYGLTETAGNLGQQLKEHAGHLADQASDTIGNLRNAVHSTAGAGIAAARHARESAERPLRDHYRETPVVGYSITAASALAIGAAAVFLADEKRRNQLFSAAGDTIQGAGKSFRYFGQLIRSGLEQVVSCQNEDRWSSSFNRNAPGDQRNGPAAYPRTTGSSAGMGPSGSTPPIGAPASTPL